MFWFPGLKRSGGEKQELLGISVLDGVWGWKEWELGLYGEPLRDDPVPISISGVQRSRLTPEEALLRAIFLRRVLFDKGVLVTVASETPLSFFGRLSVKTI